MRLAIIFISIITVITGCKDNTALRFCEGIKNSGEGVNCGSRFSTGDLTAVITSKEAFGLRSLSVKVLEIKKFKNEIVTKRDLDVDPDKKSATLDLSFYNEGRFRVRVSGKDNKVITEGDIEIVDTY